MDQNPLSKIIRLFFGKQKYQIVIHRIMAKYFPLLKTCMEDEKTEDFFFLADESLSDVQEQGLDELFLTLFIQVTPFFDRPLRGETTLSALHWARYFGLDDNIFIVDYILANYLAVSEKPQYDVLKLLIKQGMITTVYWKDRIQFSKKGS